MCSGCRWQLLNAYCHMCWGAQLRWASREAWEEFFSTICLGRHSHWWLAAWLMLVLRLLALFIGLAKPQTRPGLEPTLMKPWWWRFTWVGSALLLTEETPPTPPPPPPPNSTAPCFTSKASDLNACTQMKLVDYWIEHAAAQFDSFHTKSSFFC